MAVAVPPTLMEAVVYDHVARRYEHRRDVPVPRPKGPGEALVRVMAACVNAVDAIPPAEPSPDGANVAGVDMAGVVVALGEPGDDDGSPPQPASDTPLSFYPPGVSLGDRVVCHLWPVPGSGAFGQYAVARVPFLVRVPERVSFTDAAASACAGWTAHKSIVEKLQVGPDSSVVISGGNGGVGSFAIQLARLAGATTIITTCCHAAGPRVTRLGATHYVDYANGEAAVAREGRAVAPDGVDFLHDGVGSSSAASLAECVRMDGAVAVTAGVLPRAATDPFYRGITTHEVSLAAPAYLGGPRGALALRRTGSTVLEHVAAGRLHVDVARELNLAQATEVLNADVRSSGADGGRTVVTVARDAIGL